MLGCKSEADQGLDYYRTWSSDDSPAGGQCVAAL